MTLDYVGIRELIDIRLKQIDDDSKEFVLANIEWKALQEMKKQIGVVLVSARDNTRGEIFDVPAVGEIQEKEK